MESRVMSEKLVSKLDPYGRALEFYRAYLVARPGTLATLIEKIQYGSPRILAKYPDSRGKGNRMSGNLTPVRT